jgi:hypothetical protein
MIRALPGLYRDLPLSSGALPVVTRVLPAYTGALPKLYRLYHTPDHLRFVPAELRCFPGITMVVPGRAKDDAGKAIPSRTTPVILNILFNPGSNAGCSRIIQEVAGRVTVVPRLFPVVPWSFPDHPGRLPGLCRDLSETVA